MSNEEQQTVPPPVPAAPAPKPAVKSKVPMIIGVVVALLLSRWIFSGPGKTGGVGSASAAASSSASGSGNPLLGEWNLVDPNDAAYCPTFQSFKRNDSSWTQNGKTYNAKPIYDIQPNMVVVGYGGSYIGNWTPNGPDDLTLGQVGPPPYGVASFCKYHRK